MNLNHSSARGLLAAAALLAVAGAAQAQAGPYALLGGGRSDFKVDCSDTSACDKSGSAFQAIGGYRFAPGWALEGVSVSFGKTTATTGGIGVQVKGAALGAGGAFFVDLNPNWGLTGRLGLASVKLDGRARLGSLISNVSDNSANLYVGLAVGYNFSKSFSTELGFLRTSGEIDGENGDLTAITLSARFAF